MAPAIAERRETEFEDLREVNHCPQCGSPLIKVPVLTCTHCGEEVALRSFVYSPRRGQYLAECIDLDLISQGYTPEEAIGRLQEAMVGYLRAAFDGESTRGLVLRPSPLSRQLRYYAHRAFRKAMNLFHRRHGRHLLPMGHSPSKRICHT